MSKKGQTAERTPKRKLKAPRVTHIYSWRLLLTVSFLTFADIHVNNFFLKWEKAIHALHPFQKNFLFLKHFSILCL